MSIDARPSRRDFLRFTAGGALAGAVSLPVLLDACTSASTGGASSASQANLPTYVAFKGPKPDYPATAAGIEAGYASYPKHLVSSLSKAPGAGETITALVPAYTQPPTPMGQNAYWQAINKAANVTFNPTIAASSDYPAKLNTVVAGGDLPDYLHFPFSVPFQHLPQFLSASCTDLTPHLGGDAVKQYPNLANIPEFAWRSTVIGGRIMGLPVPRSVQSSNLLFVHQELLDKAGVSQPKSLDDLTRLFKALTRPQDGRWAVAAHAQQPGYAYQFYLQIFKGPNNWRVDKNGKFTKDIETEEFKATLGYIRELVQAGVYYPGSSSIGTNAAKTLFDGAKVAAVFDSWSAYGGYWNRALTIDPNSKIRVMIPFGHDGGKPSYFLGIGNFGLTTIPKTSGSHLKLLLRVADYLAAPLGTTERMLLDNGVEHVDFENDANGNPVKTTKGQAEINLQLGYVTGAPTTLYDGQDLKYAGIAHALEGQLMQASTADPTVGLYSPTWSDRQATLVQLVADRLNDILSGRTPMSGLSQLVSDWRSQGGDTARKEFQQAYQKGSKS